MRPNWFVAWPVRCAGLDERIGELPADVRRFAPVDRHITLAFFGGVEAEAARRAFDCLGALPAVDVGFGPVVLFGDRRKGTALSAEIEAGRGVLVNGMRAWRDAMLERAGAGPEYREPRPHMTIARMQRGIAPEGRRVALAWASGIDLSGLTARIDRIALFTWSADRRHGLFRIDRERPLG